MIDSTKTWCKELIAGWDRFWFTPAEPHTLALIRILGGAMLLYTHLVWSLDLIAFLGPESWIPREASLELHHQSYAWSHLWFIDSPALLWTQHLVVLIVFAMLTLGLCSRVTAVLGCLITISYCHRLEGALFGLDQVNAMIALYLMIGPCGAVYSLDRLLANRRAGGKLPAAAPSVSGNIAVRLLQLHLCIVYLFSGVSKMRGEMWWDGSAVWYAISNLEYQSLDITWLVSFPWLIALLSNATVFWEMSYCFLVWPKQTRPLVLFLAVSVHGGIALFLGMITFGLAMIIANLSFVSPRLVDSAIGFVRSLGSKSEDVSNRLPEPRRRRRRTSA
jgi:hypothetical protein